MKLKVAQRFRSQFSTRNLFSIQSKLFDRFSHRDASCIFNLKESLIQSAHERAAADKRRSETYSFFFRKTNHLNRKGKPPPAQFLQQSNRDDHSEDAVIGARVRNRVEMRSDQQARGVGLQPRIDSPEISCGIDSHLSAKRLHPSKNLLMALAHS